MTREAATGLSLRPLAPDDLARIAVFLAEPHVARWWLAATSAEEELAKYRRRVSGEDVGTRMLAVLDDHRVVGWCQWYRWDDHPEHAAAVGALEGECGIDYAIGDAATVGRGAGTRTVAALVTEVRRHQPGAGVLVDPDARNAASRRVLEKNGFELVEVRTLPAATDPVALYRLLADGAHVPRTQKRTGSPAQLS